MCTCFLPLCRLKHHFPLTQQQKMKNEFRIIHVWVIEDGNKVKLISKKKIYNNNFNIFNRGITFPSS
jgi:hypothetical protein